MMTSSCITRRNLEADQVWRYTNTANEAYVMSAIAYRLTAAFLATYRIGLADISSGHGMKAGHSNG